MNSERNCASISQTMNELSDRLRSDVIDRWESLNSALTEQVAVRPDRSDHTRLAGKIAAALVDLTMFAGIAPDTGSAADIDLGLIREIADASKASIFASASKKDLLSVTAYFEADGNGKYRFLRNSVVVDNKRTAPHDFLEVAGRVTSRIIDALGLDLDWDPRVDVSPAPFEDQVVLRSPTEAGTSVNIQFFIRDKDGGLEKFEPKTWQFNLLPPA